MPQWALLRSQVDKLAWTVAIMTKIGVYLYFYLNLNTTTENRTNSSFGKQKRF